MSSALPYPATRRRADAPLFKDPTYPCPRCGSVAQIPRLRLADPPQCVFRRSAPGTGTRARRFYEAAVGTRTGRRSRALRGRRVDGLPHGRPLTSTQPFLATQPLRSRAGTVLCSAASRPLTSVQSRTLHGDVARRKGLVHVEIRPLSGRSLRARPKGRREAHRTSQ